MRPTEARISAAAIRSNVAALRALAPDARLCAVVKADGYGHGVDTAAVSALAGGASWLAVATLEEAEALRAGPVEGAVPVLVLAELDPEELPGALHGPAAGVRLTVASTSGARELTEAVSPTDRVAVHLKIDTGMHRLGVDPGDALGVAELLSGTPGVVLEGLWTHLAVADDPEDGFTAEQIDRFDATRAVLEASGHRPPLVHVANSAGIIAHPASHRDLVRAGIAIYGVDPDPKLAGRVELRSVLGLVSRVRAIRTVEPGEGVSYGRRWRAESRTRVATLPVGYADGIRRSSPSAGVEVLVRGRRRPMLGVVTMDQLMIAVGDDVQVGDEAVLIGRQGSDEVTANEIATRLGTIGYEVLTALGPRIRRVVTDRDG